MMFKKKKLNQTTDQTRQSLSKKGKQQRVFSYYTASRNQLDNYDRQSSMNNNSVTTNDKVLKNSLFIAIVAIVLVILAIYLSILGYQPNISIQSGASFRTPETYQAIATDIINNDIRNRTKLLLQTEKIESELLTKLPEADSVKVVSSLLGHRSVIKIYNSQPMALFLQGQEKFILSDHGKVLITQDEALSQFGNLTLINNQSGIRAKPGMQFFRPTEAKGISSLIEQLKQDDSKYYLVIDKTPHQINLYESGRGYYVKFLIDGDVLSQYGAMRATQNKLSQIGQIPSEYIDARLADKVYYK